MKAIRVSTPGDADVLHYEEAPDPLIGADELLVAVEAAGVNFIDVYHRSGQYALPTPFTPGREGAGRVLAIGSNVAGFVAGDRVAWEGPLGAYADRAAVPANRAVAVPDGVDTKTAAALLLQGMTAHYLACDTVPLQHGDACLVHAAAGGVGLLLVQIARMRGATVIGTTGSHGKAELARAAGAHHVIVYTEQDFEAETRRITGGTGVRVVYDSVGRTTFEKSLRCLARRGTLVLYGQSSGAVAPIDPQVLNRHGSLYLTRPTLAHYTATREELMGRAMDLFGWVGQSQLDVRVGAEFPLERAADAHRALEARATTGKVLLVP